MSCGCGNNPCTDTACDPANEPLASALNNFITAFFGSLTKTCVNNQIVWVLPCDLDEGMPGYPRVAGEGLACYFIRVFSLISASTLVRVDGNDTTGGNLADKIAAGDGIVLDILNPGGNEQLEINHDGTVRITAADTTPNYIASKIVAGNEIQVTTLNPGANETFRIAYLLPASVTIGASNIDWSLSNGFFKTIAGNTTFTFSNTQDCKTIVVAVTNTGAFTAAWPAAVQWRFGTQPTLTVGAATDVFTFVVINSIIYGSVVQDFS